MRKESIVCEVFNIESLVLNCKMLQAAKTLPDAELNAELRTWHNL